MFFKKPEQPVRYGCLRGSALGIECGPTRWWFLPGCSHIGGSAQVCDPCKEQIDLGNRVPGPFECRCGASPAISGVAE
jgi:hypothetical protein